MIDFETLPLTVLPVDDLWDEKSSRFLIFAGCTLLLKHSLISISKWESIWHKTFLANVNRLSRQEFQSYVECMTLNKGVDPLAYICLSSQNYKDIADYMNEPMTAVDFSKYNLPDASGPKDSITSEVIYYKMSINSIPFDCERWHINRLIALIRIFDMKNSPNKRVGSNAIVSKYARMNAERCKEWGTKG